MTNTLRKAAKATAYAGGGIVGAVALYLTAAATLSRIPVRRRPPDGPQDIDVYLLSNGVHTDLVVPVVHELMDWRRLISYADTPAADASMPYVGFGWGDKGFYLNTPEWSQLKPRVAFEAMFWLSTTAMHATFHTAPELGPDCVRLRLTRSEYTRLVRFIRGSFEYDAQGRTRHIEGYSYGQFDAFYEARGTYNLFYTCNSWANAALKKAGQRAALWTPFDHGIFRHYR